MEGVEQLFVSHLQAEFDALINGISGTFLIEIKNKMYTANFSRLSLESSNESIFVDIKGLQLPANFFHDTIMKELQKFSLEYTITPKVCSFI